MYKGEVGADNLNIILQKALNPGEEGWIDSGRFRFSRKDKVMQLKNDYKKNIFNGDIGFILDIDRKTSTMIVNFDTGSVKYTKDELDSLTLAYAITVHKSQGSEFPVVVMPLTTQHYIMLQRNLVYTALTRAKKLMIFVGSKKALGIAVRNNKTTLRFTSLTERLQTRIHHGYF
jgi:exodeoxyribonuclease V alpha subunit